MNSTRFSERARKIIKRIQALQIPQRAKADLLLLWTYAKELAEQIVAFVRRHSHLSECLVLGALVAFLVGQLPLIGGLLALMALVTAAAVGLLTELQAEMEKVFV
jgi:hypothetical protein